ncbi:hypothetical protein QTP70_034402 [Hemibagrus guttatus]|uniref:ribonuclease H n=1 Tax=Hemibagrus guttatus TaxID=175788 RepID=A0AAE0QUP1_9TELE|nr:hypothetical protein QTP70_034402 [Hemibagrus guttatus]
MRIVSTNFIPDRSRPGLTTTAIGAVDLQGAGGNWATVGRRSRGGRRVHRQREKRKGKSVGLRIGTLNVGTMTGKGRELADVMERRKVDILCVQETRWKGSKARSIGAGFKLFYYGVDSKRNGVGVVLKEEFVRNVLEVKRVSDRVMSLKLEFEGVMLNVVSGYAPQVGCELEEKERFWSELDEVMESIPTGERVVIGAYFNGHVGEGNTGDEEVMGKFGVKERNLEGQMVVDFAKRMDMGVVNTYFQKREEHRVTYKSGGRRTQVDYILCRRGNLKEISDCKVVVGESVARQHRMVVCRMTLMVCKTKRSKIEKKTKWWKLKKEECCEEFRQKLRQALGGQVVLPDDWETTAEVIRETGRKVLGVSSGRRKEDKETWWWNEEVQDSIQRKRLAKKKWDMDRTEENRQEYKQLQRRVKREVSKAKQKAYEELYTRLDTREGEKDLYRLARQRDRDGKDVQQVRVIKDRDGRVLTSEESVQRRWKEYFEELMNEENEREKRVEGVNSVEQKVDKIRKDEVRKALKRMKSGKAVGPDDIPVEVWKCLREAAVEFLANLFNRVLESERMPEEWRRSVLVPIFKNKGDVQSCSNYRGIKLMSHTMKVWERVVEDRLRKVVEICEQQYGFMPRKSTTDAIFALRILMEKYRDGQKELHCVFVDLEKAYDRVPREELWYCMRKSGVAEKYVRVVQDMYERSRTVVRCAVGQTEEFNVEVGLHQGSTLSPFLFAIVMDQLSEEVRQESPWTMMFADDIVICSESREQVEENLERWRFALERRGMKVSRSKTEYMCVNEREGSGTVRLQGEEVKKVQEFKYLGSTVQSNGECGKEVKKRVQAGWNGWRKVSGVLCDQKISARIKGKVYRTVVRPAILYGLETVSLRKRQESELEYERPIGRTPKWATDFITMPQYNKLIIGTGDREIQLYELSSLEPYCQINSLETIPLKLDYWMWKKLTKVENVPSIDIDYAVQSPNVTYIRWKVHQDWVTELKYIKSIPAIVSTSNHEDSALVIGCIRPSTNVEQQLKEIKEMCEGKSKKGTLSISSPQFRAPCDQTVFSIYKGVKTFDICKRHNLLVTGGMDRIIRMWNPHVPGGYAPQVGCELEEKEGFWSELDEMMESIPTDERVVIGADFNGHVGEGNTGDEEVMGKFGVKERNLEGQMYRDGQRELYCVFVDLEKAYDRVPREELWYCMRKSGVAEKYVRVVQDMYERSRTVVKCAVGQTEEFKVEVGLHQGSALSPFLFAIVMDQLSEEVRQESPWTMMFADDIVICSESREQVEENLERWRFALERRGMKVSCSKTEYMCVNEREGSRTVRLQGEEVKKVQEFKYLGSTVQSNGECGKEVKKRVQAGWNGWGKVTGVLCDRKMSARIKEKVYKTVVRPAMLYGLETVSLRKRQESELELAELKMLRRPTGILKGHTAPIFYLCISSEDSHIFSVSTDNTAKIWDIQDQCCLFDAHPKASCLRGELSACLYFTGVKSLYVATDSLFLLSLKTKSQPEGSHIVSHKEAVLCCGYSQEFRQVVSCTEASIVKVWDVDTGSQLFEYGGAHGVSAITCMAFDPKGRRLVTGGRDGCLKIWNFHNGHCLKILRREDECREICDCSYLQVHRNIFVMSVGWGRRIDVYLDILDDTHHVHRPQPSWQEDLKKGHKEDILCIAQCPPSLIATGSYDGEIIVWNVVSGHILCHFLTPLPPHTDHTQVVNRSVLSLVFLKTRALDSAFTSAASLVSSGAEGDVHFWNVLNAGKYFTSFKASRHEQQVTKLVVTQDDHLLFAADHVGYICVYDIKECAITNEQKPPKTMNFWRAHINSITGLQIIENDQVLLTSSLDCTVRLWSIHGQFIGIE